MPNANVNKVIINGVTKIDLTSDTVTAAHLESGYTAHDASGATITGALQPGGGTEPFGVTAYQDEVYLFTGLTVSQSGHTLTIGG